MNMSDLKIPAERHIPPDRMQAQRMQLLQDIAELESKAARASEPGGASSRRRLILIVVPALFLAAGATYFIAQSGEQLVGGVGCYAAPRLDADTAVLGSGGDPIEICETLWAQGTLVSDEVQSSIGEIPPLTACALPRGGAVGVFPSGGGDSFCQSLGLEPVPPGYTEAASSFSSMREDLIDSLSQSHCIPAEEATVLTRRILDRHGFADWTIETRGSLGDGCVTVAFDPPARTVFLVRLENDRP